MVEVLSGDVFIKLPASRAFKQAPLSGFVPLKGQAALPIGTVVDTRKGRLSLPSTVDGRRIGAGGRTQTAILARASSRSASAGPRSARTARIPTDLALQSAPGAEASCVRTGTLRADQGPRAQHGARADGEHGEGPVPDRRRGGDQHGDRRDVGDQGPLRRHPHRRRQGQGDGAQPPTDATTTVTAGRSYLVKAKLFRGKQERRMRVLLVALAAAVVLAAPAGAQTTPAPTVATFDQGFTPDGRSSAAAPVGRQRRRARRRAVPA